MNLNIVKATKSDSNFIYELALHLSNKEILNAENFLVFYETVIDSEFSDVFIITVDAKKAGYALLNRSAMLRYRGECVEIEEIVVAPQYRNKGIGGKFIQLLKKYYAEDQKVRKIAIKTDDVQGSVRLYERFFDKTEMKYFQKYLNQA